MRRSDVRFLSLDQVLAMHREALLVGEQGSPGIRDAGLIDSAVNAPANAYGSSLVELAAMYGHGIAKNHGFVDGNKRTAVYAMLVFLEINGFEVTLPTEHWETVFDDVAAGNLSRDQLAEELAIEVGRRRGRAGPPIWIDFDLDEDEDGST